MLNGLAAAIMAIAAVALLSRLHFAWFSVPEVVQNLPGTSARKLSYPIGYWNALAALVAIGIPLALYAATGARALIWRAVGAAGVPLLALCAYLTASRGGAIEVVLGVLVFLVLAPDRIPKLAVTLVCGAGSALLIAAADQRPAVRDGLRTPLAAHQGNQLIAIAIAVAVGVALLVYAIALVERHVERPRWSDALAARTTSVSSLFGVVVALDRPSSRAGGPGFLSREWSQFKTAAGPATISRRHGPAAVAERHRQRSLPATGRPAARAGERHPLTGTGAGTFVYWWARDGSASGGFVQDAHSLYLQALGELGYPGLVLISAFIAWILALRAVGAIRVRDPERRLADRRGDGRRRRLRVLGGRRMDLADPGTAGDAVHPRRRHLRAQDDRRRRRRAPTARDASRRRDPPRRGQIVGAHAPHASPGRSPRWPPIVVIALPHVRYRRRAPEPGSGACRQPRRARSPSARQAVRLQPYAATPWLQEALVLEVAGDLRGALAAAQHAASRRLDGLRHLARAVSAARLARATPRAALADYLRARSLNPHSPVFAG